MNTLKCPYCGGDLPQGMQFCPHCMTVLAEVNELEAKPIRKSRKGFIALTALIACAVIGVCGYFILHGNDKNNNDVFSSDDINGSSNYTSDSLTEADFEDPASSDADSHTAESSNLYESSYIEAGESGNEASISSTGSAHISSQKEDISDSGFDETDHPQNTEDGLTKESFIGLVTNYCESHDTEFFGLSDHSDLNYEEDGEKISIDFTDDSGAMIFIDTDKELKHCELYFRAGQQDSVAHCEEILYVMGDMLFGCDLSGREGSFTMGDHQFSVGSYYMPELFYCEYYVTADKIS